jgi:hypothetical protein
MKLLAMLAMLAMVFVVDRARDFQEADDGEFEEDVSLTRSRIEEIGAYDQDLSCNHLGRMWTLRSPGGRFTNPLGDSRIATLVSFSLCRPQPLCHWPLPLRQLQMFLARVCAAPPATTSKTGVAVQPSPARIFLLEGPRAKGTATQVGAGDSRARGR